MTISKIASFYSRIACFSVALALFSSQGFALGLGDIDYNNYLGEPLDATITLVGDDRIDSQNVRVRQLGEADAEKLGIDLVYSPYRVQFEIVAEEDVLSAIKVRSTQPVVEPFVNLLVEVTWPTGSIYREYALLFDAPPVREQLAETGQGKSSSESLASPANVNRASAPSVELGTDEQYIVQPGDTLSGIASRVDLPDGISRNQAVNAIFNSNPGAFVKGDINRLIAGATLSLPSVPEFSSAALSKVNQEGERITSDNASNTAAGRSTNADSKSGRLTLSQTSDPDGNRNAIDSAVPQIREQIDGTQEMIDLLVKENQELRERIEKIESSEYLNTLTQLVAMQRQQIDDLRADFQAQSSNNQPLASEPEATIENAVTNPMPVQQSPDASLQPSLSQVLAANFWLFILLVLLGVVLIVGVALYLFRKMLFPQSQENYTPYKEKPEAEPEALDIDLDDTLDDQFELKAVESEEEAVASNVTNLHVVSSENRKTPTLSEQLAAQNQAKPRASDEEVKERIRQKTEQYKHSQTSSAHAPARINDVEIDVLVGLDEEINELLSMAKIYCSAGKFSEARAILTAQQKIEADPRLVDALDQIDAMEQATKEE